MTKNSVRDAPAGRYAVPSRGNCLACHGGAAVPVLGVGTLQLSPDRDPLAAHGRAARSGEVDLQGLVARGWLRRLPAPPRIAADTLTERCARLKASALRRTATLGTRAFSCCAAKSSSTAPANSRWCSPAA